MSWKLEKSEDGLSFYLTAGRRGVPGFKLVEGLTRKQAEDLGAAILQIEKSTRFNALAAVREALDIKS
jgi:hypothetical protein